jgi:hypothetical protein
MQRFNPIETVVLQVQAKQQLEDVRLPALDASPAKLCAATST